jgi:hypothetical protein
VDINQTDTQRIDTGARPGQCRDFSLKLLNNVSANGDIAFFDHLVARGAEPHRSLALHSVSRCKDPTKTKAMINHLLDIYHMPIEANNEDLREYFHASGDSGTPLNCAIHRKNIPAIQMLLDRGANPEKAIDQTIDGLFTESWVPALSLLLDAGADSNYAFEHAVDRLNFEAAKMCLQKGADPTRVLRKQQFKADKKASGSFDRERDEDDGDGGYSSEDSEEVANERKAMRELVRSACDSWM